MAATLESPLLANKAAAAGGDSGYQIEKSLRFNSADSAYLTREPAGESNRRIWTWAGWVKKCGTADQVLFYADNGTAQFISRIQLSSEGDLALFEYTDSVIKINCKTNALLRDHSAWYHIVVALDTTQATESERVKMYINGELQSLGTATYPTQNLETRINSLEGHTLGRQDSGSGKYLNSYLSDVQFIDGLQLSPAAFGSFDSNTGVWNPKAFALPAPNTGTTWSSSLTNDQNNGFNNSTSAANLFDGDLTTYISGNGNFTFTPPGTGIEYTTSVEVYFDYGSDSSHYEQAQVNSLGWVDLEHQKWKTIHLGSGTLTTLKFRDSRGTGLDTSWMRAIRIDGVILVDGQTDPTTRTNPNDGTNWTSYLTAQDNDTLQATGSGFNGNFGDDTNTYNTGKWLKFTPPTGIPYTSQVEINIDREQQVKFNNAGSYTDYNVGGNQGTNVWVTVASGSGTFTSVETFKSNNHGMLGGVRVDGHVLIDDSVDNSFQLKFNDTSLNRYLGKDTLNGKIEDATGGLPIYNTTDDYGDTKGSGYRTDSSAGTTDGAGLVFAMPGDTLTDVHASVNTGSSNNTVSDRDAGTVTSTDDSRFYGSSLKFNGAGVLKADNSNDFVFGDGAWCIEMWVKNTSSTDDRGFFHLSGDSGWAAADGFAFFWHANKWKCRVKGGGGDKQVISSSTALINTWYHIAVTYDGTNALKLYINGTLEDTETQAYDFEASDGGYINIGGYYADAYDFTGYLQDIRVYKGTAKYTANFTPPTRNDFTVNNLEHRLSTGTDYISGTTLGTTTLGYSNYFKNIFDGNLATGYNDRPNNNNYINFSNLPTASSKVEVYAWAESGTMYYQMDGGSQTNFPGSSTTKQWFDLGTGELVKFGCDGGNGSHGFNIYAIKVDGTELIYIPNEHYDVLTDTPTNYGTDTGAGGEVRGNYATFNPLKASDGTITYSQGNLSASGSAVWWGAGGTIAVNKGKWYWEVDPEGENKYIGIQEAGAATGAANPQSRTGTIVYYHAGHKKVDGASEASYGAAYTADNKIGVALDLDSSTQTVTFYKDNSSQGTLNLSESTNLVGKTIIPLFCSYGGTMSVNFGQRAFKYTAPSGFKALCTQNLDDTFDGEDAGIVNNPSKFFDILRYTGNGASTQNVKGISFQPDLVWQKITNQAGDHALTDAVRGTAGGYLQSEDSDAQKGNDNDGVSAFLSDGFTAKGGFNSNNNKWVTWLWDAGTTSWSSSDSDVTAGSFASSGYTNRTAGFSIVTYEGDQANNATGTIGHNLGTKPEFIIIKNYDAGSKNWIVGHDKLGWDEHLYLQDKNLQTITGAASRFNSTAPTATLFSVGDTSYTNATGNSHIAYCWTPIAGYSAFGKYVGNGSGNFVYTGFRPRWIMIKRAKANSSSDSSDTYSSWGIVDTERKNYNGLTGKALWANSNEQEGRRGNTSSTTSLDDMEYDIVSNGFYLDDEGSENNSNTSDYIYAAFAEHPFKIARAR